PVHDVHAAAVGLPSRNARRKVLVGVGNTTVVLFLELVFDRVRSRIAALPEGFDELVALFVIRELLESRPLLVGNNPADILVQPLLVGTRNFLLKALFVGLSFFLVERALKRIHFLFLLLRSIRLRRVCRRSSIGTGLVILRKGGQLQQQHDQNEEWEKGR